MLRQDKDMMKRQNADLSQQYREQAKRYDQENNIDRLTDDYVDSFKKQIDNLNQLLTKKEQQIAQLMDKNSSLKAYSNDLKEDLSKKYSDAGEVMPRELSDAPVALSPRNDKKIVEELRKSVDRREEMLQNGRIE